MLLFQDPYQDSEKVEWLCKTHLSAHKAHPISQIGLIIFYSNSLIYNHMHEIIFIILKDNDAHSQCTI